MKYSKQTIKTVKESADIRDYIVGAKKNKASQDIKCPFCGASCFSVVHKGNKNFAICHKCEQGYTDAIDCVMKTKGLNFIEAVESVAAQSGIYIESEKAERTKKVVEVKKNNVQSFVSRQLESSGLTEEDVIAKIVDDKGVESWVSPFQKGGIDAGFRPNNTDDEMLIYYIGLDGRQTKYARRGTAGSLRDYVRVRWSNPAAHVDDRGKEVKYQTPPGAASRAYIPEKIRQAYQKGEHIETLFLQEGEKKAEKACKHGIMSIGLQGINNIGNQASGLLQDIQYVVQTCTVTNIVLLMDSDWEDLSRHIVVGDSVDSRPNAFSKAVIKYKTYINTLHNLGISVNVWWGHVNKNDSGDKGVDDLLCNSLKGQEDELVKEVDFVMHSHDGIGKWLNIHNISAKTDQQIRDYWLLNNNQSFFERHKSELLDVETFRISRIRYKVEDDKLVEIGKMASEAEIWTVVTEDNGKKKITFSLTQTLELLKTNGFYRLRRETDGRYSYDYVHIDEGIISLTEPAEIRGYVYDYVKAVTKDKDVIEFFANRISSVLADKQLERMDAIDDDFIKYDRGVQRTCYNNGYIEVTSEGIKCGLPIDNVWRNNIIPRNFRRVPVIKSIVKIGEDWDIQLTPEGELCDLFKFICNTSNNISTWDCPRECTEQEEKEYRRHIINKITALGYLLTDYKYPSEKAAVVIQDHRMAEVGQSNGRSGKSLIGEAVKYVRSQLFMNGKNFDPGNQFVYAEVSKATRNIFIDDVKVNFNFEMIYPQITGSFKINPKHSNAWEIPFSESPKFLITTNHAINGAGGDSTKDRIIYMEFSSWYNAEHSVVDDFHHYFFEDWDEEQWNLFDNLMAECAMFYMRSMELGWYREGKGAVQPPMGNINLRTQRQEMGETLYQWAEEYFDETGTKINSRISKRELYNEFTQYAGNTPYGVTPQAFKKKLKMYCSFKGYDYNPDVRSESGDYYQDFKKKFPGKTYIGGDDKSNGTEYIRIYCERLAPKGEKKPF